MSVCLFFDVMCHGCVCLFLHVCAIVVCCQHVLFTLIVSSPVLLVIDISVPCIINYSFHV